MMVSTIPYDFGRKQNSDRAPVWKMTALQSVWSQQLDDEIDGTMSNLERCGMLNGYGCYYYFGENKWVINANLLIGGCRLDRRGRKVPFYRMGVFEVDIAT